MLLGEPILAPGKSASTAAPASSGSGDNKLALDDANNALSGFTREMSLSRKKAHEAQTKLRELMAQASAGADPSQWQAQEADIASK